MQNDYQTAILLFSRSARQEALHKQLAGPHSYRVSKTLLRHALREARKSGLPVCTSFSPQQQGYSFGERLANATEGVFAQGFSNVIIIGSDSPGLDADLLRTAHTRLQQQEVVLGPAADGGFYLIGLSSNAYQRERFIQLAWESTELQLSFNSYLTHVSTAAAYLHVLVDLDTPQNFADWQPIQQAGRLLQELKHSLQVGLQLKTIFFFFVQLARQACVTARPHRGPPAVLLLRVL